MVRPRFRHVARLFGVLAAAALILGPASTGVIGGSARVGAVAPRDRAGDGAAPTSGAASTPGPEMAPGLLAELAIDPGLRIERLDGPPVTGGTTSAATVGRPGTTVPASRPAPPTKKAPVLAGRNHVWSSALRLDRRIVFYPCSRTSYPGMAVYRWGCAGSNNVYLFAHAGGPFRRLHDLYVRGRLHRGLTVTYADSGRRVHRYVVAWWRVVLPTQGGFAFAAQSRPSMTLQTCVGPNSRYRLVVRLYQSD